MGYIINADQTKALRKLLEEEEHTEIELLWLPWYLEVKLWRPHGHASYMGIDLSGQVIDESESNNTRD